MTEILKKIENFNTKHKLSFEEESHTYTIEKSSQKQQLTSVTTFLSNYFPFDAQKVARIVAEKQWVTQEEVLQQWKQTAEIGTYIHLLAEKYCNKEQLALDELQKIVGVEAFFKTYPNLEVIGTEVQLCSPTYQLAGTIDVILQDRKTKKIYLLDWKTSQKKIDKKQVFSYAKTPLETIPNNKYYKYCLQLSMYALLLKEEYQLEIWDFYLIHLTFDGNYEELNVTDLRYEAQELLKETKAYK